MHRPSSKPLAIVAAAAIGAAAADAQVVIPLPNVSIVHQGAQGSDAFSAIHHLGSGRIIAGKRSSGAGNRFLLSADYGINWSVVGCPGSTGAHTYFFGSSGARVLCGTGDTGNACLMASSDAGASWTVALTSAQIRNLTGSSNARAVFGPVHLGSTSWIANVKTFDTASKVIMSLDDGATWFLPAAQPGQGVTAWARQMILTGDDVLLWPSVLTDRMWVSIDRGGSWFAVTVPGASLFQPLCDAGDGVYLCGDATTTPQGPISLHRSADRGQTWTTALTVNLQRPTVTYWRDVIRVGDSLFASACCVEGTSNERFMRLYRSDDRGVTWRSYGNPMIGPYGGMQAIYQMCTTGHGTVFAACQPDSTILRWQLPKRRDG